MVGFALEKFRNLMSENGMTLSATLNRALLGHTNLTLKYHLDTIDMKKVLSTGTQTVD